MKTCCQEEACSTERKQQGDVEGESLHTFITIETVTPVWVCTAITCCTAISTWDITLQAQTQGILRLTDVTHTQTQLFRLKHFMPGTLRY